MNESELHQRSASDGMGWTDKTLLPPSALGGFLFFAVFCPAMTLLAGAIAFFFVCAGSLEFHHPQPASQPNLQYSRKAHVQITQFQELLKRFKDDVGRYPTDSEGLDALLQCPHSVTDKSKWRGPYIDAPIPQDPWGKNYIYRLINKDRILIISAGGRSRR